jgi:iron-sulfur cluster assembly protein
MTLNMIQVTETASKKIQTMLARRGAGVGIRLGVKTTGCSGLAYVLEYVDAPKEEDQCFECQGCKVFVDPKSCAYLQGLTVDYVRNGLNEGFEFINPNERDRCGCGESFRV